MDRLRHRSRPVLRAIEEYGRRKLSSQIQFSFVFSKAQPINPSIHHRCNAEVDGLAKAGREKLDPKLRISFDRFDSPLQVSINGTTVIHDYRRTIDSHLDRKCLQSFRDSKHCGKLIRRHKNRVISFLKRSTDTMHVRFQGWFVGSLICGLSDARCLDMRDQAESVCALCSGNMTSDIFPADENTAEDLPDHYVSCSFISHTPESARILRQIHTNRPFSSTFNKLATCLHDRLAHILKISIYYLKDRTCLPESVIDSLCYSYLTDLADGGLKFKLTRLLADLKFLPTQQFNLDPSISTLSNDLISHIQSKNSTTNPLAINFSVIVVKDLHHLPNFFCKWHIFDRKLDSAADRFGSIPDLSTVNQHDCVSLLVFSKVCSELRRLVDVAKNRARSGSRTWIPHVPPLNKIPLFEGPDSRIEKRRIKHGGIWFTCFQHFKWVGNKATNATISFPFPSYTRISEIPKLS